MRSEIRASGRSGSPPYLKNGGPLRAGCAPSESVMIGDRLDYDIRPARLLGWRTIRVALVFPDRHEL
jgi:ribonucleotide monophosphatase NagD (HAD superfamily)